MNSETRNSGSLNLLSPVTPPTAPNPSYEDLLRCHKELVNYILILNKRNSRNNDFEFMKHESMLMFKTNQDLREMVKNLCSKINLNTQNLTTQKKNPVKQNQFKNDLNSIQNSIEKSGGLRDSFLLENKTEENKRLSEKINSLQNEILNAAYNHQQEIEAFKIEEKKKTNEDLNRQIKQINEKLEIQTTKIIQLEETNQTLKKLADAKSIELKNYEEKFILLQTRLVQVENELTKLKNERDLIEQANNQLTGQRDALKNLLESIQSKTNTENFEFEKQRIEIVNLNNQISNSIENNKTILEQNQKYKTKVKEIEDYFLEDSKNKEGFSLVQRLKSKQIGTQTFVDFKETLHNKKPGDFQTEKDESNLIDPVQRNKKLEIEIEKLEQINLNYKTEISSLKKALTDINFAENLGGEFDVYSNPEVLQLQSLIDQYIHEKKNDLTNAGNGLEELTHKIKGLKLENKDLSKKVNDLVIVNHEGVNNIKELSTKISQIHNKVFEDLKGRNRPN